MMCCSSLHLYSIQEINTDKKEEQATLTMLKDLAQKSPMTLQRIIVDEENLGATFKSIRNFLNELKKEIDKASQEKFVDEADIDRFEIEFTDAQTIFKETMSRQALHHKHNHRQEHAINKAVAMVQKSLKALRKKTIHHFMRQTDRIIIQALKSEVEIQTTKNEDRRNF